MFNKFLTASFWFFTSKKAFVPNQDFLRICLKFQTFKIREVSHQSHKSESGFFPVFFFKIHWNFAENW